VISQLIQKLYTYQLQVKREGRGREREAENAPVTGCSLLVSAITSVIKYHVSLF
jgi:hypothetical protein